MSVDARGGAGGIVGGVVLLVVATAIVAADIAFGPALLQAHLLPMLGERATDYAVVETLFAVIIFGVLIAAALVGGAIDGRNVLSAGDRPGRGAAIGLAVGVGGVSAATGYAALAGTLVPGPAPDWLLPMILWGAGAVAIQTSGEEIFFRGWVQPGLVRRWGAAAGVGVTALVFAGAHIIGGARAPVSILNLFLGGLMFGLFALRGRGLAAAALAHFGWNATEQLVWGVDPNPGVGSFGAIADHELVGRALWGGSGEGLNAGIGMTFVLLAILAPLAVAAWRGRGEAVKTEPRVTPPAPTVRITPRSA